MIRHILAAFLLLAASSPALAQSRAATSAALAKAPPTTCPEGRTASGSCVNPKLAGAARQQAVCYSQYKLSYIACPGVAPSMDQDLKYPFNVVLDRLRELNRIINF